MAVDIPPELAPGSWVTERERLAIIRSPDKVVARAYVSEDDVGRLRVGQGARFFPDAPGRAAIAGSVAAIDQVAVQAIAEPLLTMPSGGRITSHLVGRQTVPDHSLYRVDIAVESDVSPQHKLRGQIVIRGKRESILARLARSVAVVVVREWGT